MLVHFVAANGGTRHWEYLSVQEMEYQLKLITINLPIAIAVTGVGKIAVGVTTLRIFGNTSRWKKWAVWAMLILLTTVSAIDIFVALFRCGPPKAQWNLAMMATAKCLPTNSYDIFNQFVIALQTFSDYFFSILPMIVVWRLQMSLRRRLTVMFLLGLTLITGAIATLKMYFQIVISNSDITWTTLRLDICYVLEAMFIIVFGSMPVLNPLWEACTRIRLSSGGSKLTEPPRESSATSYEPIQPHKPPPEKAAQDAKWMQAGDLELARLTGYPAQLAATAGVEHLGQSEERQNREEHWKIHVHQQLHQSITPAASWYERGDPKATT